MKSTPNPSPRFRVEPSPSPTPSPSPNQAGPALLASLPQLHVLSTALPPPPTLVVRHLKLSFFPREDAQGEAGSLSVDELPTGHSNTGVPELESVRRAYLSR